MVPLGFALPLAAPLAALPAQTVCAERGALLNSLSRQYSEAPRAVGLANNGNVLELLSTRDGKTWTLVMTQPDGVSCVVAAGEAWQAVPQQLAGGQSL